MTATTRKLARQLKTPVSGLSRRRQALITAVDTATQTVSIQLGGDTTVLTGIATLLSYAPRVGDVVWVDQVGPDLLVLGAQGIANVTTTPDPQQADIDTVQSTASQTYTNLATIGPAVTLQLAAGTPCLVIVSARISNAGGGPGFSSLFSYAVTGASTQTATDPDGVEQIAGTEDFTLTRASVFIADGTGAHAFTMKYRVIGTNTGTFFRRRIVVWPSH